jgi:hypothetical protein
MGMSLLAIFGSSKNYHKIFDFRFLATVLALVFAFLTSGDYFPAHEFLIFVSLARLPSQ